MWFDSWRGKNTGTSIEQNIVLLKKNETLQSPLDMEEL